MTGIPARPVARAVVGRGAGGDAAGAYLALAATVWPPDTATVYAGDA